MSIERFNGENGVLLSLTGIPRKMWECCSQVISDRGGVYYCTTLDDLKSPELPIADQEREMLLQRLEWFFAAGGSNAILLLIHDGWVNFFPCHMLEEPMQHDTDTFTRARHAIRNWRGESG